MINRIHLQLDEPTRRRLERAAARQKMNVQAYCMAAVQQKLLEDELLQVNTLELPQMRPFDPSFVAELRELHEEILVYRNGKPLDVDEMIHQMREEREREIIGMY